MKVALFVAGLAGAFLAAFALAGVLDVRERGISAHAADAHSSDAHSSGAGAEPALPAGLSLEQDGYRLVAERSALAAGEPQPYVFRILDPHGSALRDYDVEHERRLHLIVVSRTLRRFLHVHPQQRPDGAWTAPLTLPESGFYRVFADFSTGGERRTLGLDLEGVGQTRTAERRPTRYDVTLHRHGQGGELLFNVRDAGKPVELEPYLGARGHLVVLREGDLAYVHAHADRERLSFDVPLPSEGRYRLFLQFRVAGAVETVSLELER